jgi:glycerophosphoryl diester phosphodiesterase
MEKCPSIRASVVESFLQSKTGPPEDGEDVIHLSEHFIAVIDGATSKTRDRWDGKTGGRKAAEIIDATFHQMPPDCTARQAADQLTSAIRAFYVENGFATQVEAYPERRITASVVAISLAQHEIWSIGDCQFMLDDNLFSVVKKVDQVVEEVRAFFLESEILAGQTTVEGLLVHDPGREFIIPLLERQYRFQNNPNAGSFYYAAVDGFPIPDDGIVAEQIPDDVTHIVLASDGYPFLRPSLAESEQLLADLLQRDPLLFRDYKSTKGLVAGNVSFDDRAYVKVQIERVMSSVAFSIHSPFAV